MLLFALPLVSASLLACGDGSCDPGNEYVELLDELSAEQVLAVVEGYGLESSEEVVCEQMCLATYQTERGWEWMEIATCSLSIDHDAYEASLSSDSLTAPVGQVACTGAGIEYLCE